MIGTVLALSVVFAVLWLAYLWQMSGWSSSDKIHIRTHASLQEPLSPSPASSSRTSSQSHSERYSKNTQKTLACRPLLLETSPSGQLKACFFGTQYRLQKLERRLRAIGKSIHILQGKSFPKWQNGAWCSVYWGRLPDGTMKAFPSKTMLLSSQAIHLPGAPLLPKHLSGVVGSSLQ